MEKIFSCTLPVNGSDVNYHVVFENEQYVFTADDHSAAIPRFSIVRAEDEWKNEGDVDAQVGAKAIAALEKYLLSQH